MRKIKDLGIEFTSPTAEHRAQQAVKRNGRVNDALASHWYKVFKKSGYPRKVLKWNIYRKILKYDPELGQGSSAKE